jgi:hypothetical protein
MLAILTPLALVPQNEWGPETITKRKQHDPLPSAYLYRLPSLEQESIHYRLSKGALYYPNYGGYDFKLLSGTTSSPSTAYVH